MTCVWDGLIKALKLKYRPIDLMNHVKTNNRETKNVVWNDIELTEKQYTENMERIKELNPATIGHGYDCSSFDPLLFLIAELYDTTIVHNYIRTQITYKNKKFPDKKIIVHSNERHFWH